MYRELIVSVYRHTVHQNEKNNLSATPLPPPSTRRLRRSLGCGVGGRDTSRRETKGVRVGEERLSPVQGS